MRNLDILRMGFNFTSNQFSFVLEKPLDNLDISDTKEIATGLFDYYLEYNSTINVSLTGTSI